MYFLSFNETENHNDLNDHGSQHLFISTYDLCRPGAILRRRGTTEPVHVCPNTNTLVPETCPKHGHSMSNRDPVTPLTQLRLRRSLSSISLQKVRSVGRAIVNHALAHTEAHLTRSFVNSRTSFKVHESIALGSISAPHLVRPSSSTPRFGTVQCSRCHSRANPHPYTAQLATSFSCPSPPNSVKYSSPFNFR